MIHKWQKCEDKEQHVSCFIVASASHFDGHGFFFKNPLSVKERGTPNLIKHMFWRFRKKVKLPYFSLGNIVFIFFNRLYQVYPITSWFSWCFNFHSLVAKICKVSITHRIHGAGIYANIGGILMVNVTIYMAYMDPMGYKIVCFTNVFYS